MSNHATQKVRSKRKPYLLAQFSSKSKNPTLIRQVASGKIGIIYFLEYLKKVIFRVIFKVTDNLSRRF
jgi:hypothetical protein